MALQAANRALASFVGPRGLQRLVACRRREGILLPFKIRVRRGLSYFTVEWLSPSEEYIDPVLRRDVNKSVKASWREPGGWREKIGLGDVLLALGMKFRVVKPAPQRRKQRAATLETVEVTDVVITGETAREAEVGPSKKQKKKDDERGGEESEEESEEESDDDIDSDGDSVESFEEDRREDRIYVDRPWLLEDMTGVAVSKRAQASPLEAPGRAVSRMVHSSLPAKKLLQVSAVLANRTAAAMRSVAGLFDEDSSSAERMRLRAARADYLALNLVKANRAKFTPNSLDFRLRRNCWRFLKTVYKGSKFAAKFVYEKANALVTGGNELNEYCKWEMSQTKVEIRCEMELRDGSVQAIGMFSMDTEASCEVMREYLARRFGDELNALKVGNSYRFKVQPTTSKGDEAVKEEVILERAEELFTFSKDYCSFKIDNETMIGTYTVVIVPEMDVLESGMFQACKPFSSDDDDLVATLTGKGLQGDADEERSKDDA